MPSTVANRAQASRLGEKIGHLIRFFKPDLITAPEAEPSESGLGLVWLVIVQAKFSASPRNACLEWPGSKHQPLRQPWHGSLAGKLSDSLHLI